ncbi:alginate biosynthesis protein Alg44 [Pseudomonas sp. R5(2019)]|uniref:alginate biosynthesis protein Alg44 n=1 Tax=Pseudomonas sp. R5(2019) TaxID=2697566 RepID=UPI001412D3A1|nr:alginate biosynthesis protein Alg44 [Pseudomonas sp. R5(2019)]NBA94857.1 HlyD family efflux transporter periplasmic adaptor subunit [Pseudomonas sp. R5(2019)]
MSTASIAMSNDVVHESEVQRQHVRLKLPAKLKFYGPDREMLECELLDLSAGGFSLYQPDSPFILGRQHKGKLVFQVDGLGLAIDVEFVVRSFSDDGERVGCEFQNLRPREIAALRYLITAYLSGVVISLGDMLATLQRENFTKPRKHDSGSSLGFFGRLRATTLSLLIFLVGLCAFGFVLYQLYGVYFVTHAESARVNVPGQLIGLPRDGSVTALAKVGAVVAKGAPLASFSASLLDVMKGNLPPGQATPENLERLFSRTLQGSLTSPCDCRVVAQLVPDGQVVGKGTTVFELMPTNGVATIEARFPYKNFSRIQPGKGVNFQVVGEEQSRSGKITTVMLDNGGLASDLRVTIVPDSALQTELAGRPVEVSIENLPIGNWLSEAWANNNWINKVMAATK